LLLTTLAVSGLPTQNSGEPYFPDSRDPQTLTILTLKAGVVELVERKISR
jgi:hypothetical protein